MRKVLWFGLAVVVVLAVAALAQPAPGAGGPPGGQERAFGQGPGGPPPGAPNGTGGPAGFRGGRVPPPPTTNGAPGGELKVESTESSESSPESTMGRPVRVRPTKPEVTPTPAKTGAPITVYLCAAVLLIAAGGFCLRMSLGARRG
jgi:hypothetical protein